METWNAIHEAAASLVMSEGFAHATIDAVAARAGVSRRTFFNYFQTKEDAVLGLQTPELSDEALAQFLAEEGDVLSATVRLVLAVSLSATRLSPNSTRRRELLGRFPELRVRIQSQAAISESLIMPALHAKLGSDPDEPNARAIALQRLAITIVRFAFSQTDFPANLSDAELDSAIALFRDITR